MTLRARSTEGEEGHPVDDIQPDKPTVMAPGRTPANGARRGQLRLGTSAIGTSASSRPGTPTAAWPQSPVFALNSKGSTVRRQSIVDHVGV